ncbi:MAG: VWA domain-containing protein [Planctomycetota bacterium]
MVTLPLVLTAVAAVATLLAELLHGRRVRRVARLAFGPRRRSAHWTSMAPLLRAAGAGALAWGLATLLFELEPKVHHLEEVVEEEDLRHLLLVLDVSPSMQLVDAGPNGDLSRRHRGRDVLTSMFSRIALGRYRITVVATYSGALPVVIDTDDAEVVRNVLTDLPMHFAFKPGETKLFDGLEEAAKLAKVWPRDTATLVVVSDGDTLPPTGTPVLPPSVVGVLVVGVGDPVKGSFINGRNSRQDVSALRQMALRLGGNYHDGNQRHIPTEVLGSITAEAERSPLEKLTKREYALLAAGLGAVLLALIPLLLARFGTAWQPGRVAPTREISHNARRADTIRSATPGTVRRRNA